MSRLYNISLIFCFIFLLFGCDKSEPHVEDKPQNYAMEQINGLVQKGPFINGTTITLYELNSSLVQTGKSFSTQIINNKGKFELRNINLSEPYIEIQANGFYFNEVSGEKSDAQLTLHALSNVTDSTQINVNILSELEKNRVTYLVNNGKDFSEAKAQAQQEILRVFNIDRNSILSSEYLDISKSGDGNAILLAISAIIQGYRTDAEVSELLANINTDMREDGILNSSTLQSDLVNHAKYFRLPDIRQNLEKRYESLGVSYDISDYESIVQNFLNKTEFEFKGLVEYPENGSSGSNILDPKLKKYNSADHLSTAKNSITAINTRNIDLRLEIVFNQDCTQGDSMNVCIGNWGLWVNDSGWNMSFVSDYSSKTRKYVFTNDNSGLHDMKISLTGHGFGDLELYENDSIVLEKRYTW